MKPSKAFLARQSDLLAYA